MAERVRDSKYSLAEISKHNKPDDCWIVILNKVYDVTEWLEIHPGGRKILGSVAGQDVTEAFHGFHPISIFQSRHLPRMQIGVVSNPVTTPLLREFHKLRKTLREEGLYEPDYWFYISKTLVHIIHFYIAIWATLHSTTAFHYIVSASILGIFWQQLSFVGHDFGHNSASQSRKIDWIFGILQTMFYGVSLQWWKQTHNVHHTVTNSIDYDPDIQHLPVFAVSEKMLNGYFSFYHMKQFVFSKAARYLVSYQHISYYFVMAFARFNLYSQGWILCLNPKATVNARYAEIAAMSFFITWNLILLSYIPDNWMKLLFLIVSHAVCGIVHIQITISHFALPAYWGHGYELTNPNHWVEMQLATSMDVDCPWWMDWFHGGLQFQVEHHLFPRLPRNRLRYIKYKYILPLAKKHGLRLQSMTFLDCVCFVYQKMRTEALKARDRPVSVGQKVTICERTCKHPCEKHRPAMSQLHAVWNCEG